MKCLVLKDIRLGYGSSTRNPNPITYKIHKKGEILQHDVDCDNGNVWFIDKDGDRGKIEAGCVQNLINRDILQKH